MSIDPLAAGGGADLAALIDAELAALAADAQALHALLVEDAVVTARVLPSNGLTDLLEIAGRRVAASLPPTVRPGDVLQVRVTGFDGDRILLQIVTTGANAAVEPGPAYVPIAPDPALFVAASIQPAPSATPPPTPAPPSPGAQAQPAPPPSTATPPAAAVPPAQPGGGGTLGTVVSRATVAAATGDTPTVRGDVPFRAVVVAGEPTSIEARLAASRAATGPRAAASSPAAPAGPAALPPPAATIPPQRFVPPPPIGTRAATAQAPAGQPVATYAAASTKASPTPAPRTGLAAYAEPVALLRALRLPVTPSSVASATMALERPERLPVALATLERALPRASADPHVATLRTLLSFVGRIDPRSPALSAQIAAYVDHVVDGTEPKLTTLLAAVRATAVPAPPAQRTDAPPMPAAPAATATAAAIPAQPPQRAHAAGAASDVPHAAPPPAAAAPPPALPAAVAAERGAALGADLKQSLLAFAANPATSDALAPALASAISALTAVQVSAAQTLAANPNGIAFTIPLTTQNGPATARISVSRDGPQRGSTRVDGENFRIAFVLDTAHYGTVAIDLVTVGRDVTVDVRAESAPAMRAFRDALGRLTTRLESLRYRVASAGAALGVTSTVGIEAPPASPTDPDAVVDRSA